MKALTVQQPWAWAIIYGGKDVENRTANWSHRGPLAIHAGIRWSNRGAASPLVCRAAGLEPTYTCAEAYGPRWPDLEAPLGAIIGVVDLVGVHLADPGGCCTSPWAETEYVEHGGRTRRQITHLELRNPRPVDPIPCKGALGLWTVPDEVLQQIDAPDRWVEFAGIMGVLCSVCGMPTETEPCAQHQPAAYGAMD